MRDVGGSEGRPRLLKHPASVAYQELVDDGLRRMRAAAVQLDLSSQQLEMLLALVRRSATATGYEWVTAREVDARCGAGAQASEQILDQLALTG